GACQEPLPGRAGLHHHESAEAPGRAGGPRPREPDRLREHQQDRLPHVRRHRGLREGHCDARVPADRDVGAGFRGDTAAGSAGVCVQAERDTFHRIRRLQPGEHPRDQAVDPGAQRAAARTAAGSAGMKTIAIVAGARPNFMKIAPIARALRSGDMAMPEEINRIVTDSIADLLFVSEPSGVSNLLREGKARERVFHVGQVMVDNLIYQRDKLADADTSRLSSSALKARYSRYGVVTLHRPSNVDDPATFSRVGHALREISQELPLIFPVHPRTRANLERFEIDLGPEVVLTAPLSYMEFLNLWKDAVVALTDSGGLQEETTPSACRASP